MTMSHRLFFSGDNPTIVDNNLDDRIECDLLREKKGQYLLVFQPFFEFSCNYQFFFISSLSIHLGDKHTYNIESFYQPVSQPLIRSHTQGKMNWIKKKCLYAFLYALCSLCSQRVGSRTVTVREKEKIYEFCRLLNEKQWQPKKKQNKTNRNKSRQCYTHSIRNVFVVFHTKNSKNFIDLLDEALHSCLCINWAATEGGLLL